MGDSSRIPSTWWRSATTNHLWIIQLFSTARRIMSTEFDRDDLARLLALEHAFYATALVSAANFAKLQNAKAGREEMSTAQAVQMFRDSVESSLFDRKDYPPDVRSLMSRHLKRMFDHVANMA